VRLEPQIQANRLPDGANMGRSSHSESEISASNLRPVGGKLKNSLQNWKLEEFNLNSNLSNYSSAWWVTKSVPTQRTNSVCWQWSCGETDLTTQVDFYALLSFDFSGSHLSFFQSVQLIAADSKW